MKSKNNLDELQNILFETLRDLKDGKVEAEDAKAINDTAQTILNSAKVRIQYAQVTGDRSVSNFMISDKNGTDEKEIKAEDVQVSNKIGGYIHKAGKRRHYNQD